MYFKKKTFKKKIIITLSNTPEFIKFLAIHYYTVIKLN